MFPADFGHLCERLRRAQGRGPSGEKDARAVRVARCAMAGLGCLG